MLRGYWRFLGLWIQIGHSLNATGTLFSPEKNVRSLHIHPQVHHRFHHQLILVQNPADPALVPSV